MVLSLLLMLAALYYAIRKPTGLDKNWKAEYSSFSMASFVVTALVVVLFYSVSGNFDLANFYSSGLLGLGIGASIGAAMFAYYGDGDLQTGFLFIVANCLLAASVGGVKLQLLIS